MTALCSGQIWKSDDNVEHVCPIHVTTFSLMAPSSQIQVTKFMLRSDHYCIVKMASLRGGTCFSLRSFWACVWVNQRSLRSFLKLKLFAVIQVSTTKCVHASSNCVKCLLIHKHVFILSLLASILVIWMSYKSWHDAVIQADVVGSVCLIGKQKSLLVISTKNKYCSIAVLLHSDSCWVQQRELCACGMDSGSRWPNVVY